MSSAQADIVIVDDVPANLKVLSSLLSSQAYKVRPVTTGAQALRAVESALPDLILLDIRMPEMDGYEVCRHLKSDPKTMQIPVIFISAADDIDTKVKGFELGAVDYITKPFQDAEVLARVDTHINLFRLRHKLNQKIVALEQANTRIKELSIRDELTGLYNRRHFNEQAIQFFNSAKRYKKHLSLMIGDIDFFKYVNDTFSHAVGDEVLKIVAHLLSDKRRKADIISRYGGEEFVVIFPETSIVDAVQVCETMRKRIETYFWHEIVSELKITMSMGLCADTSLESVESMLKQADKKLYNAKAAGRNNLQY